jgi:hypothetical protein
MIPPFPGTATMSVPTMLHGEVEQVDSAAETKRRLPYGVGRRRYGRLLARTTIPAAEALEGRLLLGFLAPTAYGVGGSTLAVVTADFNGDGPTSPSPTPGSAPSV